MCMASCRTVAIKNVIKIMNILPLLKLPLPKISDINQHQIVIFFVYLSYLPNMPGIQSLRKIGQLYVELCHRYAIYNSSPSPPLKVLDFFLYFWCFFISKCWVSKMHKFHKAYISNVQSKQIHPKKYQHHKYTSYEGARKVLAFKVVLRFKRWMIWYYMHILCNINMSY